jgi:hypothetical protein
MGRIARILKYTVIYGVACLGFMLVVNTYRPLDRPVFALGAFAVGLFVWRRYDPWYRWQNRWTPEKLAAERIRAAAEFVAWNSHPQTIADREAFHEKLRAQREMLDLHELRGRLAYDREAQETWNYDGTRKTPREQVVAMVDTYSFEVTEGQYRFMQEFFDDALEPGIYTFKKSRSGPERIAQ